MDRVDQIVDDVRNTVSAEQTEVRQELIGRLQRMLREQLFQSLESPFASKCPICDSEDLIRYGRTKAGTQRYQCRGCKRVFSAHSTGNLFANTKLSEEQWDTFVECFVDRDVLKTVARKCDVTLKTAWFMRFRVMELVNENLPSFEVKEGIRAELDEFYTIESFKGNQKKAGFEMPREPYRHGTKGHPVGLSNDKLCILTGITDLGDSFYDIVCRGWFDRHVAKHALAKNIEKGSIIVTDNHGSYVRVLREMGVEHESHPAEEHAPLNRINSLHSSIRAFLQPFNGVSSKYLGLYLGYHKWLGSYGGMHMSKAMDNLRPQMTAGNYQTVRAEIPNIAFPFRDAHGNPTKY